MKTLHVNLGVDSYDIHVGRGLLDRAGEFFSLDRKVLIVTDDGVPAGYAERLCRQCGEGTIVTLPQGEGSKTMASVTELCRRMMSCDFHRGDCVVAVGGGVMGDLAGFAAASYMRGIDFYNIPTTVLSQVDSSVGGKTGVNLDGIKNIVGAFKQPKGVLADLDLLASLPKRQIANGLSEAVKMALTFDASLFSLFEEADPEENMEEIITRSIALKIKVVEEDEKETGLRKVLNFGHTVGHGIESLGLGYYHGECVALGMLPMCSDSVKARLLPVLKRLDLPSEASFDLEAALNAIAHDKKAGAGYVSAVFVDEVGSFRMEKVPFAALKKLVYDSYCDKKGDSL